ncbi:MAG: hypothetical protein FWE31_02890 [Firmicutes bacterium]|nr:hypothetical protein [Bacillota bacterium]
MEITELVKLVGALQAEKGFDENTVEDDAILLLSEVGEMVKAYNALDKEEGTKADFHDEVADVTILALAICAKNGIDIEKAILAKLEKLREREYQRNVEPFFGEVYFTKMKSDDEKLYH